MSKLTDMMEVLLKTRTEAALGAPGTVDVSQVNVEQKSDPKVEQAIDDNFNKENVHDIMRRMPMPANEDERLEVVKKMGYDRANIDDLIGDADFMALTKEAMEEFKVTDTCISSIDGDRETLLAAPGLAPSGNGGYRRLLDAKGGYFLPARHHEGRRDIFLGADGSRYHAGVSAFPRQSWGHCRVGGLPELGNFFGCMMAGMRNATRRGDSTSSTCHRVVAR